MARQNTAPVSFQRSVRSDAGVLMSSGRAGVVTPMAIIPLLRGDSASGPMSVDLNLAEMPKPLLNGVFANVQAWFVPKSAFAQFSGMDEFYASYMKAPIKALGQADRAAPVFYNTAAATTILASDWAKTLGLFVPDGSIINTDFIDACVLVYNFRLAAHSSKLARQNYYSENPTEALKLQRAFWPSSARSNMVPDYERALLIGALDLDVTAGKVPIAGLWNQSTAAAGITTGVEGQYPYKAAPNSPVGSWRMLLMDSQGPAGPNGSRIWADLAAQTVTASLADIDKARTTQAFAKLRASYAGNNTSGFIDDSTIIAHLMQGLSVPGEQFRRPWLLDSKRVPFGFAERFASDGASLDQSVSTGRTSINLSLNVPHNDMGGYIVVTCEVLPERIDERMTEMSMLITDPTSSMLPDALRDIQRTEPVDNVLNRRIDAKHATPNGLFAYEPMNDMWNRVSTRLGGVFYQPDPAAPTNEARAGIWLANVVNPKFNTDHYLAPSPFPHTVFADTTAPAFEFVVRHSLKIVGLTQIGDVLVENNDDYKKVIEAQV